MESARSMSARHSGSDPLLKSSSGRAPFSGETVRCRPGSASASQERPSCPDDTSQPPGPQKTQRVTSRRKPRFVSSTQECNRQSPSRDFALSRQVSSDAVNSIQFLRAPEAPPTTSSATTEIAKSKLESFTQMAGQVTVVERTIPAAMSRFISVPATTEATAHGALLVVGVLLNYAGQFMMPRFREACDAAIALREHRSQSIRKAATELLPRLAQYCPDAFSRSYLATTTEHLLKIARQRSSASELRDASYAAIGRLALAVRHHLITALPDLVQVICEHGLNVNVAPPAALPSQPRSSQRHMDLDLASTPELRGFGQRGFGGMVAAIKIVQHLSNQKSSHVGLAGVEDQRSRAVVIDCVADVVEALRDELGPHHIDALLDALFAGGLSEPLIRALNVVSKSLPSRRPLVRARLLDELTSVLITPRSSPYAPPGWSRPVPHKRLAEISTQKQRNQQLGRYPIGNQMPRAAHRRLSMISGFQNYGTLDVAPAGIHNRSDRNRGMLSSSIEDSGVLHVPPEREGYILLALQALGEFSMEGVCLLPLVRDCVSRYLDCATSSHIRAAAVVSCARLLLPPKNFELDAASASGKLTNSRLYSAGMVSKLQLSAGPEKKGSAGAAFRDERHRMRKQTAITPAATATKLAFVEESAHNEYDECSEDDEDNDFGDDEEGDGDEDTADTDSASVATSTDSAHIIRRQRQDDADGFQNEEHTIIGISSSARSQPSDDSTVIPHTARRRTRGRKALKRRATTTDASSTRTDDSNESILLFSRQRSTSRQLADDISMRGDGLGSAASVADRRMRRPCPSLLSLMDSSLGSRVDDTLPPWYYVGPSAMVVEDVLRKLLRVALADVESKPRAAVLRALRADDRFDKHLCRARHIEAISLMLHDEDAELQLAALALLGRLAAHNPAAALSHIRAALSRALAALRCEASDAPV